MAPGIKSNNGRCFHPDLKQRDLSSFDKISPPMEILERVVVLIFYASAQPQMKMFLRAKGLNFFICLGTKIQVAQVLSYRNFPGLSDNRRTDELSTVHTLLAV